MAGPREGVALRLEGLRDCRDCRVCQVAVSCWGQKTPGILRGCRVCQVMVGSLNDWATERSTAERAMSVKWSSRVTLTLAGATGAHRWRSSFHIVADAALKVCQMSKSGLACTSVR